jgi:hypothetical protein
VRQDFLGHRNVVGRSPLDSDLAETSSDFGHQMEQKPRCKVQGARCKTIDMTQKGEQSLPGVSDLVCSLVVELAGYGKETAS